jgi:hypothetical protein
MNPFRPTPAPSDPLFALLAYLLVIIALLAVLMSSGTPARRAVRLLFLYLAYAALEIIVKRLTHFSWYVYPIKFSLFGGVIAAWWTARPSIRAQRVTPPLTALLLLYGALAAIQIFNPNQGNPLIGILGWMTDFMYIVLFFVAFDLLRDERNVERLLWVTAAIGVLSALSCFTEMWIGAEELQRQYPTFVPLLAYGTDGSVTYRPTTLVPYMEVLGVAAMVALLALKHRRFAWMIAGISICIAASLFHAVRITWITAILFVGLFVLLEGRKSWVGVLGVAACAFAVILQFNLAGGVLAPSFESLTTPLQTYQQNRLGGLLALSRVISAYPLGLGVGEGGPGLRFLASAGGPTRLGTHNYLTDLAGQLSLAGPLLFLAFGAGIEWRGFRSLGRRGLSGERRVLIRASMALFGAMFIAFFGGGALGAYPENEYFWLMAGVIARLSLPEMKLRLASPVTSARRPPAMRGRAARTIPSAGRVAR